MPDALQTERGRGLGWTAENLQGRIMIAILYTTRPYSNKYDTDYTLLYTCKLLYIDYSILHGHYTGCSTRYLKALF